MFTGIIEAIGRVESVSQEGDGRRIRVSAPFASELKPDDSVAVDGVCLTVVGRDAGGFEADIVAETLGKTNLDRVTTGERVNLERPVRAGGRLDGHIVQGHVDARGEVEEIEVDGETRRVTVRFPSRFAAYVIPVGSITLDGISFTIADLTDGSITVAVIPHTWTRTTIQDWQPGRPVNLEFDIIGKYVVRAVQQGAGGSGEAVRRFLTG